MKVLRDGEIPLDSLKGASLAIGNFDGVHRGHQAVLEAAKREAAARNAPAGVVTFEPHPRQFFQPDRPLFRLTPLDVKLELFSALDLDLAVVLTFDQALAALTAEAFVRDILVNRLAMGHAVIGFDFFFGRGRGGDPDVMRALGRKYGFGVTVVEAVGDAHNTFSSSRIREFLASGNPRAAAEMLGYWWRVSGVVHGGAKRGMGLGFPTANLSLDPSQELCHGIYAVRVYVDGKMYHGAAYLGTRPTFDNGPPVLEAFLFDFSGDLYGKRIAVEFIDYVRGDAKFDSPEELKAQIAKDCETAKAILAQVEKDHPMSRLPLGRARRGQLDDNGPPVIGEAP